MICRLCHQRITRKTKICSCCKKRKALTQFNARLSQWDKLQSICRVCQSKKFKKWHYKPENRYRNNYGSIFNGMSPNHVVGLKIAKTKGDYLKGVSKARNVQLGREYEEYKGRFKSWD